jgi:hypothetical protein
MTRIFRLGICIVLLGSFLLFSKAASAGTNQWSTESIPSRPDNLLGPPGVDIRDLAFFNNGEIIYAAPGDSIILPNPSITSNMTYKSIDGGNTWLPITVPITTDLIAVMPEDSDVLAIANKSTLAIYLSVDAGLHWKNLDWPDGENAAINDIAISPQRNGINYLAVVGIDSGSQANLWYFELGIGASPGWHETKTLLGFALASEAVALAFSPTFGNDPTAAVITNNSTNVTLQLFNFGGGRWNGVAGYPDLPCEIVYNSGIDHLDSASLALAPDFNGYEPATRHLFIGLSVNGTTTANATSCIYRVEDTKSKRISDNIRIHSIAFNGQDLVAGGYDTNKVYSCNNPYDLVPIVKESDSTKSPGGTGKVVVAWLGGTAIAGTSGDESAFAISEDNGFTFNDISLIDTTITNAEDVVVADEGNKIYLVTDDGLTDEPLDGPDVSVWLFDGVWLRVFCKMGIPYPQYIVRIESGNDSNGDSVYLARRNSTDIYYSSESGTTRWRTITCFINVQDLTVTGSQVIYVIDAAGRIAKSSNDGAYWDIVNSNLNSGATIVNVSANVTLAGSQNGFVAYTLNGGFSWTKIPQIIESGASQVQVVADENFTSNKIIYAASDKPHGSIWRYTIGTSENWMDIYDGDISGGVYGLAITNNIIYALECEIISGNSTLWRHLEPATIPEESTEWIHSPPMPVDVDGGLPVILNATPQALKSSPSKLWAVRTNGTNNKLYSYNDGHVAVTLLEPKNGYYSLVNSLNSIAYDISFGWKGPAIATKYDFVMAEDEDFFYKVATANVSTTSEITYTTIGPHQSRDSNRWVFFVPAKTYYWKVRIIEPSYSAYSETRHFTVSSIGPPAYEPVNLLPAETITLEYPSFSWYPLSGVTEYQFLLSDNPKMTSPLIDTYVETTTIKTSVILEYGTQYYWCVRQTKPAVGDWSALGTFMVLAPVTAETVTVTPPPGRVFIPYFITFINTPGYVIGAITTMLILIGTVFVLLFNRRSVNISGGVPMKPQTKLDRYTEFPQIPRESEKIKQEPTITERDKEGPEIIIDAKHFLWMVTQQEEVTNLEQHKQSEKDHNSQGKKLADKIYKLSKKFNLYVKYPEDAAMLLAIWAEYHSKKETSSYLIKSFDDNPYNAIKFLKCYLPTAHLGIEIAAVKDLDLTKYNLMAEVISTEKVYETLSKIFKFKAEEIEDIVPVMPSDRDLANQFMRLHIKAKGLSFTQ